jgi:hypothetical protein
MSQSRPAEAGNPSKSLVFPLFLRIFPAKPLIRWGGYAIIVAVSGLQLIGTETRTMYPESEILFPSRVIPLLEDLRGDEWRQLVGKVKKLPETHVDALAFSMMMITIGGCLTCDLDSYRASLGCATCAKRTIGSFKGTDKVLKKQFEDARKEVSAFIKSNDIQLLKPEKNGNGNGNGHGKEK